jgi:ribonuclease E
VVEEAAAAETAQAIVAEPAGAVTVNGAPEADAGIDEDGTPRRGWWQRTFGQ